MSLLLFIFLIIPKAQASWRLSLGTGIASKKITGTDGSTGTDGTLISNGNFTTGLNFNIGLAQHWHLLLGIENRSYDFDNTDKIIEGETKVNLAAAEYGLRWILFASTAMRFLYTIQDDVGFEVNDNNKAVLYKQSLGYASIFWDQIVYLGETIMVGFKVGYDLSGNGGDLEARSGSRYGIFMIWNTQGYGQIEGNLEIKNITKNDSQLDYIEKDSNLNFIYTITLW